MAGAGAAIAGFAWLAGGTAAGQPVTPTTAPPVVASSSDPGVLTVSRAGCPSLSFTGLPDGWGDSLEVVLEDGSDVPSVEFAAPSGRVMVAMGTSLDGAQGQIAEVDGYNAVILFSDESRLIQVGRADCEGIRLTFDGLDEAEIAMVIDAINLDNGELTDVDVGTRVTNGTTVSPALFDRGLFERVDADPFVDVVSAAFGPPDDDTGWTPMPSELACTGATEYRSIFWGDLRVVFERSGPDERLTAWSVGDQSVPIIAPTHEHEPTRSLDLPSDEGVAVGADRLVLEQFPLVGDLGGGRYSIAGPVVVGVTVEGNMITGFGTGRLDCLYRQPGRSDR